MDEDHAPENAVTETKSWTMPLRFLLLVSKYVQ